MASSEDSPIYRRDWLKLLSILTLTPEVINSQAQPVEITKEKVVAALALIGLQYNDAEVEMLLPEVNRLLTVYSQLRQIDIKPEVAPPLTFSPVLPGTTIPGGRSIWSPPRPRIAPRPKNPEDIAYLNAGQLGAMIRARRITSTELTRLYLDRLRTYAPKLNCLVTLTADLALDQAARADSDLRRGRIHSLLHGVPYGAKDLFDTSGILTTWGAEPYRNRVPDSDATVIEKLRGAGAVLVAKLSMGALAQGGLWFGGLTHTPWNYSISSSGSSAGSAAATSAGLVGFSIGTETLGSILLPSVRCGVAGLRPTFGRVSRKGAMTVTWSMDKVGPICRTVADCAEVLRVIAGADGKDLSVIEAPLNWNAARPLRRLKVGYLSADFDGLDAKTKLVYDEAFAVLSRLGVRLEPTKLPDFPIRAIGFVLDTEAAAAFDELTRDRGIDKLSGQAPDDWPNQFRYSRFVPAVEYIQAQRARALLMRQYGEFMREWDVLLSTPGSSNLNATNLTGNPQIVVPCGFVDGMPQGLAFTGRLFEEGLPLRLAHAYEQATDWHTRRPALQS
jgi:Asp-tRNA(Asn)/Glu-tRNA(Gln) amidotransferase A subunit family amidase